MEFLFRSFVNSLIKSIIYMPVVLYLDIPQSPTDLNITYLDYSMISVQWKPGFDGGWTQSFNISLDNSLWKETNESYFTFTRKIIEKGK